MYLSIFSNVIKGATPTEVARKTRSYGLRSVQLIPDEINIGWGFDGNGATGSFVEWAEAYQREGVEICGIGGYLNLLHHNLERREHNLKLFEQFLRAMQEIDCRYVSTETGSFAASGDWDFDPINETRAAWDELRRVTERLLNVAVQTNTTLLYEPYIANVCSTPERGARFVREFDSVHLALLMDPTNWFDNALAQPEHVQSVIERGFAAERGLFRLAHAKDMTPPTLGADRPGLPGPGQGIIDYALYITLLRQHAYTGALVIEHLTEDEVPAAMRYVQSHIDQYGG
jgi:sugar phosphate isomerase/epimerase